MEVDTLTGKGARVEIEQIHTVTDQLCHFQSRIAACSAQLERGVGRCVQVMAAKEAICLVLGDLIQYWQDCLRESEWQKRTNF